MRPAVVALVSGAEAAAVLAARFEEEGVPLHVEQAAGDAVELARAAAARSVDGLGIGGDSRRLVVVLAAFPARPYLEAASPTAASLGRAAARIVARRPVPQDG